jgi:hypothetical protein
MNSPMPPRRPDPQFERILARLKLTVELIRQECIEKERCVKHAEEILRQVSSCAVNAPMQKDITLSTNNLGDSHEQKT